MMYTTIILDNKVVGVIAGNSPNKDVWLEEGVSEDDCEKGGAILALISEEDFARLSEDNDFKFIR